MQRAENDGLAVRAMMRVQLLRCSAHRAVRVSLLRCPSPTVLLGAVTVTAPASVHGPAMLGARVVAVHERRASRCRADLPAHACLPVNMAHSGQAVQSTSWVGV